MAHLRRHSLDEEWRAIPDFPDYEININGDVYNKRIDRIISASYKGKKCTAVNLRRDGKNYLRSVNKLVSTVFPVQRDGEWRPICDYPDYEINKRGEVYNKKNKRFISQINDCGCGKVSLYNNEGVRSRSINKLVIETFPPKHGSEWREIHDYPDYEISIYGDVYSKKYGKILTPGVDTHGYYTVSLYRDGVSRDKRINRLVAEAFIPNPSNKPQVNHINGVKTNNHVTNLEWATCSENIKHAYDTGLRKTRKIKIMETGEEFGSVRECAKYLGLSERDGNIYACLNGRRKTCKGFHFEEVYDE